MDSDQERHTPFYTRHSLIILRKAQIDSACAGNPTMLIWLGKQMLNQTDSQEIEHIRPIEDVEFNGI